MSILPSEKTLITLHSSGLIKFSNVEKNTKLQKVNFNVKGSSIAASPASSLVAVGSSSGVVRIYNAKEISYNVPKLLFRKRIHSKEVSSLLIDPSGKLMASSANDGYIFLYDLEKLAVIGFFKLAGVIRSMRFEYCDDPAKEGSRLYVLRSDPLGSSILTFEIPEKEKIAMVENSLQIQKTAYGNHEFCYDGELIDFCVAPKQTLASKSIFYTISTDTTLRVFTTPTNLVGDVTNLTNQLYCYKDHSKLPIQMSTSLSGEWIRTCGSDGLITIRSVIEPDKGIKFMAHDPLSNGAFGCAFSTDYRYFISVGNDGLCRRWDWKYSVTGRRAAAEVAESIERQIAEQAIQFAELDALPTIEDSPDDAPDEASLAPIESSQDENSTVLSNEKEVNLQNINIRFIDITFKPN
jgi:WD40 repeat protein